MPPLTLMTSSAASLVALDVDLVVVDALAVQLRLEPRAESAPGRRVHRQGAVMLWSTAAFGHTIPRPCRRPLAVSGTCSGCATRVLAGLDPEQRAAAAGGARAGLHPRRRRHRQDPRDHPPHRLPGAHRRGPARPAARRHLHRPRRRRAAHPAAQPRRAGRAGAHLPRGGAAPAAVLRAAGARRRRCPTSLDNPLRLVGNAAARLRLRVDRTELRDLAAEIDWAKAVLAAPDDYPERGPGGRPRHPDDARHGRRGLRRVRAGQAPGRRRSTSPTCC